MERDFLGMKDESWNISQDAASLKPAVQRSLAPKASAMHQFMPYKVGHEERQKKYVVNPGVQALPTVDAFVTGGKRFSTQAPQACFTLVRKANQQFPMHAYNQPRRPDYRRASAYHSCEPQAFPVASRSAVPVAMSSPFFKLRGSQAAPDKSATSLKQQPFGGVTTHTQIAGPAFGGSASLSPNTTSLTSQLTIFYAGSVNVFDFVSLEEAQEIMSLASKRTNVHPRSSRSEAGLQDGFITKKIMKASPIRAASPCSALSSPKSVSWHNGTNPQSSSSAVDDEASAKPVSPLAKNHGEVPSRTTTASATPRAVPQARKASLARFLEKRKARLISVTPYSSSKKITETGIALESGKMPRISSLAGGNLSSIRENFWCYGNAKSNITRRESPSTKLEM